MSRPCTCQSPPTVDLTDSFVRRNSAAAAAAVDVEHDNAAVARIEPDADSITAQRQTLLHNLKVNGWSVVQLEASKIARNDPVFEVLQHHRQWKDMLVDLFENNRATVAHKKVPELTYRSAESGAPGSTVEPKQSWEIKRCYRERSHQRCTLSLSSSSSSSPQSSIIQQRMDSWANLLHAVAITVRQVLKLPQGLLLQEQPCCCCYPDNNNNNNNSQCSIDLMRAFFYDTVVKRQQMPIVMGSSPHTDWGSFTVVYQDHVGGLQTFCHGCQKWVDVTSAHMDKEGSSSVPFVVHVGDVTSLAIGQALQAIHHRQTPPTETTTMPDNYSVVVFPSPRHRVLSPTKERRGSLVYFAYPPPERSISAIAKVLESWCTEEGIGEQPGGSTIDIPYDDYYLLQNQANNEQNHTSRSAKQQYQAIANLPLRDVLKDKWEQVQR